MNESDHERTLRERIIDARGSADYRIEQVIDAITEAIVDRMVVLGLNRKELAQLTGVSPARITSLLRGTNNFTVRTLVDVSMALGCDLSVTLIPHDADAATEYAASSPRNSRSIIAAEARASYGRSSSRTKADRSRDEEIRAHLASGKLRVEGDDVLMRRERDRAYHPATFRRAGAHSDMEKTNVGRRAYYRERILAVAREGGDSAREATRAPAR